MAGRRRSEREERLRFLLRALVEGAPPDELIDTLLIGGVRSLRGARGLLKEALRRLAEEGDAARRGRIDSATLAVALRRREKLFRQALLKENPRLALEAEKDRCRLLGAYLKRPDEPEETVEDRGLEEAIDREMARLAAAGPTPAVEPAAEADGAACAGQAPD